MVDTVSILLFHPFLLVTFCAGPHPLLAIFAPRSDPTRHYRDCLNSPFSHPRTTGFLSFQGNLRRTFLDFFLPYPTGFFYRTMGCFVPPRGRQSSGLYRTLPTSYNPPFGYAGTDRVAFTIFNPSPIPTFILPALPRLSATDDPRLTTNQHYPNESHRLINIYFLPCTARSKKGFFRSHLWPGVSTF